MPKIVDREEMRGRILDAATTRFFEQGYHNTKMTDIARAADLAKGTLYLYFKSKEELMLALLTRYFGDIRSRIQNMPRPEDLAQFLEAIRLSMPVDRLGTTRMFIDILGPGFEDPKSRQVIGNFFDWLSGHYAGQLRQMSQAGQVSSELDHGHVGGAITSMLDGLVMHLAVFDPSPEAFESRRDAALELLKRGLQPS